jgi:hypothetical protein
MVSLYPFDFPSASRARVEAARLRAVVELEESKQKIDRLEEYEAELRKYILREFAAFSEEALELGRQGIWLVDRMDSEVREFLERVTLQAQLYRGYDQRERAIVPMTERVFGHVLPAVWREFEKSGEWRSYQAGVGEVAELQSANKTAAPSNLGRTTDTLQTATSSGKIATKPRRRSARYVAIDQALCDIAKAKPRSHEEVFRMLDTRKKVPNAEPFQSAGGWFAGFRRDPAKAHTWLSKTWSHLNLPAFARGPK